MAVTKKTVLITGCSAGGIGDSLAQTFHEQGYHVFATARNTAKIAKNLSSASDVTVLQFDVLSAESIAAAVQSVSSLTNGKLDVLVNNSGAGYHASGLDTSIEKGKELFDLNVWAPWAVLQAFAPLLIAAKGCVVNNSSGCAKIPLPFMSVYNASKAAIAMASETWQHELEPLGVRCVTIYTTSVKTNFFAEDVSANISENSPYYPVRDFINSLGDGHLQANGANSKSYASTVVKHIKNGGNGSIWAGATAAFGRLGCALFPPSVFYNIVESVVPASKEMTKAGINRKG